MSKKFYYIALPECNKCHIIYNNLFKNNDNVEFITLNKRAQNKIELDIKKSISEQNLNRDGFPFLLDENLKYIADYDTLLVKKEDVLI